MYIRYVLQWISLPSSKEAKLHIIAPSFWEWRVNVGKGYALRDWDIFNSFFYELQIEIIRHKTKIMIVQMHVFLNNVIKTYRYEFMAKNWWTYLMVWLKAKQFAIKPSKGYQESPAYLALKWYKKCFGCYVWLHNACINASQLHD